MADDSALKHVKVATPQTPSSYPHPLTLSVMRLSTPLPQTTPGIPFTSVPTCPSALLSQAQPPWESEGTLCGVGHLTVVPSSFGSIYASETFRSFVSVFNQTTDPVHYISISVQIQTSSQRLISLLDTSQDPRQVLEPRGSINNIVKLPLPELGVHKLLCAVTYRTLSSSPTAMRTLRHTFRFNVLPPLEPSCIVRPLSSALSTLPFSSNLNSNLIQYLVELRILNAVPVPVYITDATFVPKPPFCVRSLIPDAPPPSELSETALDAGIIEPRNASLGVGDVQTFLFQVYCPHENLQIDSLTDNLNRLSTSTSELPGGALRRTDKLASRNLRPMATSISTLGETRRKRYISESFTTRKTPRVMGHMTISWRSALGEVGHLDNVVTAEEPVIQRNDVEICIYSIPERIEVHQPFVAKCAARNNMEKAVRLYLQVRRDLVGEIVPVGISGVSLGEVKPGSIAKCTITLIALSRGQHNVSGVRVVDVDSSEIYKADAPVVSVA